MYIPVFFCGIDIGEARFGIAEKEKKLFNYEGRKK